MLSHSFRVYLLIYVFCKDHKTARYDEFTPPFFINVKDFWGVMGDFDCYFMGFSFCGFLFEYKFAPEVDITAITLPMTEKRDSMTHTSRLHYLPLLNSASSCYSGERNSET